MRAWRSGRAPGAEGASAPGSAVLQFRNILIRERNLVRAQRWQEMKPVLDPRAGDIEDDASSTKNRSLLALAGTLLSEISLPKLLMAWLVMLVVPCLVLGLSPLIASAWAVKVFGNISFSYAGLWPIILLAILLAVGWLG